eukprot:632544-Pyramimonas_sp.AAC.1
MLRARYDGKVWVHGVWQFALESAGAQTGSLCAAGASIQSRDCGMATHVYSGTRCALDARRRRARPAVLSAACLDLPGHPSSACGPQRSVEHTVRVLSHSKNSIWAFECKKHQSILMSLVATKTRRYIFGYDRGVT